MIRPATLEDKIPAARMIYETMGTYGDAPLGLGSKTLAIQAIEKFFIKAENRFSWQITWRLEDDKDPAEVLVAFPVWEYFRRNSSIAWQLWSIYGLRVGMQLIWESRRVMNTKETEKDELYVSHIAIAGEHRRKGYTRQLLDWAAQLAKRHDLCKCSLTVDIDNHSAISLYKKMGYSIVDTVLTPQIAESFYTRGHHRVVQNIKQGGMK